MVEDTAYDICPVCGREINLALLHGHDRAKQAPVHVGCLLEPSAQKLDIKNEHAEDCYD